MEQGLSKVRKKILKYEHKHKLFPALLGCTLKPTIWKHVHVVLYRADSSLLSREMPAEVSELSVTPSNLIAHVESCHFLLQRTVSQLYELSLVNSAAFLWENWSESRVANVAFKVLFPL